jgi:2-methylisocitrate lyase-like PEP mutase family enzyme
VDGEIVICDESGWVDFGAVQACLSTRRNSLGDTARRRPKGAVAHYRALVDAGARYFIVVGLDDAEALRRFAEQVVP